MKRRALAIFDLDYTLLEGDSEELWARFLFRQGLVDAAFVGRIEAFYRDYEAGQLDFRVYEEFLLGPLTVRPAEVLLELRRVCLDELRKFIRPKMIARVELHRQENAQLVLITACNSFLAEPLAELLGFAEVICSQVELVDGEYTGRTCGVPAFRHGKVIRLAGWLRDHPFSLAGSWCYGDSYNDLPLLELVDHPVMVAPDAKLRKHGLERGWELLEREGREVMSNE